MELISYQVFHIYRKKMAHLKEMDQTQLFLFLNASIRRLCVIKKYHATISDLEEHFILCHLKSCIESAVNSQQVMLGIQALPSGVQPLRPQCGLRSASKKSFVKVFSIKVSCHGKLCIINLFDESVRFIKIVAY